MARLVKMTGQRPHMLTLGGESKAICTCGLSQNFPFCNGSHKQTHDETEGKTYIYENGQRKEVN